MIPQNTSDFDDVGQAIAEGRSLRPAANYRIRFAQEGLQFRTIDVADPVPLGRQILAAGGVDAHADYSLFAILATGDFEDVRLDEPFDLRGRGAEKFVAFQSDRDFKLRINEAQVSWGKPAISGRALYELAAPGAEQGVFLEVRGGEDRFIEEAELVDLTLPGIEHFITAPKPTHGIHIVVNGHEVEVAHSRQSFEELVAIAYPGEPPTPNITYNMTYRRVASVPHSGELAAGGYIEVKNGSIVNVGRTIQS
jgi:multiubiquitin